MPLVRLAAVVFALLAFAAPSQAASTKLRAPGKLRAFLANQPLGTTTFPRTPAFAWNPVRGAGRYELVLSTSPLFAGNGIVWDDSTLTTPVAAVPVALPWITGTPHSLYARVRGISSRGAVGAWSASYGFDVRWTGSGVPQQLPGANGLVRWTPVDGATSYEVWYLNANVNNNGKGKIFSTTTNVADEREYYTFHQSSPWIDSVLWRVRAVRQLYGAPGNNLPTTTYGPWSPTYTSTNTAFQTGGLTGLATLAEPVVTGHDPLKDGFQLTPAFTYVGNSGLYRTTELYRVYVFSDQDCVNPVFKGALVGSPAYAPRATKGPLELPPNTLDLSVARSSYLGTGVEGGHLAEGPVVEPNESKSPSTFTPTLLAQPTGSSSSSPSGGAAPPPSSSTGATFPASLPGTGAPIGLWDTHWPTGRYTWTVVPVEWFTVAGATGGAGSAVEYWDSEVTQDACGARSAAFGKASQAAQTANPVTKAPFAWGLSAKGGLRAAKVRRPVFAGAPLVGWRPALGASAYEVQWSKTAYPWRPAGNLYTYASATTLDLKPGTWYYRVRGIDLSMPTGASTMAWSDKTRLVLAKPRFKIVRK